MREDMGEATERLGEVLLELGMLHKTMEELEAATELLVKKLEFITASSPTAVEEKDEPSRMTTCGGQLQSLRSRLSNQLDNINSLRSNLEI